MAIDHEARIHRDADGVPIYLGRWGWSLRPPTGVHPFYWRIVSGRIIQIYRSDYDPREPCVTLAANDKSQYVAHVEHLHASRQSADKVREAYQAEYDREREERERSIHERIKAATNGDDDERHT